MKSLKRRTFLVTLGAGASVGYLLPMKGFAQSGGLNLSRKDYKEIRRIKINLRLAYSNFCLSPDDEYIHQLETELASAQAELDDIISLEYTQLRDLEEVEPWILTNMPQTAMQRVRNSIDNESEPQRRANVGPCSEAALEIFADVIGFTSDEVHQLVVTLQENEAILGTTFYLEELVDSILDGDFNRAKTHLEIFLNLLTNEEVTNAISRTLRSREFRMLVSWLVKRKVPVIGLALLIAELLIAMYRNRESMRRCLTS